MPVDDESDNEYVMLVEEEDDPKRSNFLDHLSKLKDKYKFLDQELN